MAELRRWLRQLHDELKFTSVFVTHDQEEAMEVADRVVVMSQVILSKLAHRAIFGSDQKPVLCLNLWGSEPNFCPHQRFNIKYRWL